jgi:hypothetical protein
LGQLVGLFRISDDQGVQNTRASDLELCLRLTLADLDKLSIGSAGLLKEIANVCNLLWHDGECVCLERSERKWSEHKI